MPRRQPFTKLCRQIAQGTSRGRCDLHVHTTASDGAYAPAEVVDLALRSGLTAISITDHDTTVGIAAARRAAPPGLETISGVEITAEHEGREVHLLGYFIRLDDLPLGAALARLRRGRIERFFAMISLLARSGVHVDATQSHSDGETQSLGRRHLAELLVRAGRAQTLRDAFTRYLHDRSPAALPKLRLPIFEALHLVRTAGGVASFAHPPYDLTLERLDQLHRAGMQAVEVEYHGSRPRWTRQLREWAHELGMAITGGSDCHGPDEPGRALGSRGIDADELETLRRLASP